MSAALISVSSAPASDWTNSPSTTDQEPRLASGVQAGDPPEKSSRNSTVPSGAVTVKSSYAAAVAQVDRPTPPVIGCGWTTAPVALLGTTRSPTLFMNS